MARGKKKESVLTLEKKLAQALVPDWEQPYKVPKNWCWVRGVAIFKEMETRKPKGEFFDYIDIDAIDNSLQVVTAPKHMAVKDAPSRASRAVHYGDTVFSLVRPYLKNIAFIDESLQDCIASTGFYVCSPSYVVIPRYLYLLMISSYVVDGLNKYMKGDNSPSIRKDDIELFAYPVPPRAEQQRIIDRIEYLFTKLDEAKEKAQSVLDSFETRKAAILHKAFIGELTAKWRAEHGKNTSGWKVYSLKDCCRIGSGGTPSRKNPEYYKGNIPWIKTGEIDWNEIDDAEEKISDSAIENSSAKLYEPGAVLVAMYGMGVTRGRAAILQVPAATNQAVCVLQPAEYLLNKYLFYYFMCNYWDIREQAVGGNQLNLSGTIIGKFQISIPSLDEQTEIVRILDSLFVKEQQAKDAAEAVLEKIDLLKKSILARAFRGELGTNDPLEESAIELIKQILSEKIVVTEPKKPRKIKTPEVNFVAKTIMQALASGEKLTPENLKAETDLQIDDFYDQLKILIDNGQVVETRVDGEAYLEANNADRQPNN